MYKLWNVDVMIVVFTFQLKFLIQGYFAFSIVDTQFIVNVIIFFDLLRNIILTKTFLFPVNMIVSYKVYWQ